MPITPISVPQQQQQPPNLAAAAGVARVLPALAAVVAARDPKLAVAGAADEAARAKSLLLLLLFLGCRFYCCWRCHILQACSTTPACNAPLGSRAIPAAQSTATAPATTACLAVKPEADVPGANKWVVPFVGILRPAHDGSSQLSSAHLRLALSFSYQICQPHSDSVGFGLTVSVSMMLRQSHAVSACPGMSSIAPQSPPV